MMGLLCSAAAGIACQATIHLQAVRMAAALLHRSDMQQLLDVAVCTCRRFRNSKVSISKPKPPSTMSSTRSAYFAASIMPCKSCSQATWMTLVPAMRHCVAVGNMQRWVGMSRMEQ